jgi:hypothetical protein
MPAITRFTGLVVAVPGGGSKGHSAFKNISPQVGIDIQIPTNQTLPALQISQPDGTVIYTLGPAAPLAASGALPTTGGSYVITKTGAAAALTLAAPTANGATLTITSQTGFAHTITTAGLLRTGAAPSNVATFAAFPGASLTLFSANGFWNVISQNGVTFT